MSLQATLTGFKTAERTNLNVNANDRLATGPLTMEIGALTEEVSVTSPVTPLQSITGERSFTLQSEALTNIANNGRALFNFATLVPGALSQETGNRELGSVGGFTVNGQRPNSNNITIDGVANIDTGDNGGNMATTNIDSVAEFKILTNAIGQLFGLFRGSGRRFVCVLHHGAVRCVGRPRKLDVHLRSQSAGLDVPGHAARVSPRVRGDQGDPHGALMLPTRPPVTSLACRSATCRRCSLA